MMNDECEMMNERKDEDPSRWQSRFLLFFSVALCLCGFVLFSAPAAIANDAAQRLNLFERNSLAGWQYGDPDTSGWTMKDGVLSADSPKHELLSGWTFGDFELRFGFKLSQGGSLTIGLPTVPNGPGPTLKFEAAPAGSSSVTTSANDLSLRVAADRDHSAVMKRDGQTLSLAVDGNVNASTSISTARLGLSLAAHGAVVSSQWDVSELPGEPIFNGHDLTGWYTIGNPKSWLVEDGKIVLVNRDGNYLRTEKLYGNFTLSLEYKIARGGNSGVGIRTPRDGWPSGDGMELQILDEKPGTPMTRHSTMAIYGNLEPLAKADKPDQWNQATIKADGYMISAWINGQLVQQADTSRLPELKHRHLTGWIGLQDHNAHTEFRNLRVLEAPAGVGLEAWKRPRPLSGAAIVLNRLMNLDSLTRPDGAHGYAVSKKIDSDAEETIAELEGPGALVEWASAKQRGQAAFYFDGSAKPAVDSPASQLAERLPLVGPPGQPLLLTYVPFKRSLKLVVSGAGGDHYRLLYVSLPRAAQVETFGGADDTVPRGWLPAISYRYQQHGWGGMREQDEDIDPRTASGKHTLERNKPVSLVKLDGSGIVEWVKLHVPGKVLAKDDLWLEVRVDGEDKPAISAPARYLFPGLAGGSKYQNFTVLYSKDHGFVNRLAMPFAEGIEISAVNRGKRPIKDVELVVSVDRSMLSPSDGVPPCRLRGVYQQDASEKQLNGRGRCVGMIYSVPGADSADPVMELTADSQPIAGWSGQPLGTLFGVPADQAGRFALAGRADGLLWRWLLEAPLDFERSITLRSSGSQSGARLLLFYIDSQGKW